jgi:glycosyltransferase involved in cell wall biosynthesis
MKQPGITVAICTHDNAEVLDRCLRKLARQRVYGHSWELLVVDNRSSDATPEVLRRWQASGTFRAMRVVREEQLGLSNARRTAIREARADLIAFIDDDCFLRPGWISAAIEFARRNPRAGAFGGEVRIRWDTPPAEIGVQSEWALARQLLGKRPMKISGPPLVGAGIVIRREALIESGWIERAQFMGRTGKSLTSGDDAEISFRVRAAGWDLWYTPTMKIDHVLAAWRSDFDYLARLHYGIGLTLPYIWILAGMYDHSAAAAVRIFFRGVRRAIKTTFSAWWYQVRGKTLRAQQRRLETQMHLGTVRGVLRLPQPESARCPEPVHAVAAAAVPAPRATAREAVEFIPERRAVGDA